MMLLFNEGILQPWEDRQGAICPRHTGLDAASPGHSDLLASWCPCYGNPPHDATSAPHFLEAQTRDCSSGSHRGWMSLPYPKSCGLPTATRVVLYVCTLPSPHLPDGICHHETLVTIS